MGGPGHSHRGNLATPTSAGERRERAVLANFVAIIDPDNSGALAEKLLAEHRTLARLLAQHPDSLARTLGGNSRIAAMILASRAATLEAMRTGLVGRRIHPANRDLIRYLKTSMGALRDEALRILFLDASRCLIADEQLQNGTLAQLAIYPRTIFRRALELDAAAVILVHNHPSGDPTPSRADIEATERLSLIGRALDIEVLEHIVVTLHGHRTILEGRTVLGCGTSSQVVLREPAGDRLDVPDAASALANAQKASRRRLLRRQLVGAHELFGEPAWDMLIDLFIHEGEAKAVSTSSLCIASGLPMSSALRLLQRLCDFGLVTREADRHDGRRNFIRLAPGLRQRLTAYFEGGDE